MPVVSKQKIYIDASLKEFMREVKYSSTDKNFSAELPPKVVQHLMRDRKHVSANTESACVAEWEAVIKEYNEAKRETSIVILFRIKLNGFIHKAGHEQTATQDHNKEFFRLYEKDIEMFDSKGLGMFLEWGIYEKQFYKEQKKFIRKAYLRDEKAMIGTGFKDGVDRDFARYNIKEIPYSEEREFWFTNLERSFGELLIKVKEKLHSLSNDQLQQLVDSNTFKLLTN